MITLNMSSELVRGRVIPRAELFPKLLGSKAGGVRAIVETPPELDASIFEVEVLPLS
jgi:hypothetical protein